jgi:hypothetical protein
MTAARKPRSAACGRLHIVDVGQRPERRLVYGDDRATTNVANADNNDGSPYGAPWLQPVAISGKSDRAGTRKNKRNPLPWVATAC